MVHDNQTEKNLVTIVTVTYNAEDLLEKTILSVINQSYKDIEYIIIDGDSTDRTIDIVKKYENKIDFWVSEPDEGIYYAMNKAIEKASGKWINFMNAGDTFFDLDTVAYVMNHKDNNAELIYGDYKKKISNVIIKAQDQSNWNKTIPFCHQTLFTETNLMKNEPFDTNFKIAADHNFILTMYQKQKNFQYLGHTLAIFEEGGYANSNTVKMCIESLKVLIDKKVTLEDIYLTSWYKYLYNTEQSYHLLQNKHKNLMNSISNISKIHTLKHPIKKFKAYKKLLALYYQQK